MERERSVWTNEFGAVAIVTFSQPPQNYFDAGLLGELADELELADRADHIRAIVIRSEGKVFCAGAQLRPRSQTEPFDPSEIYRQGLRLFHIRKPVVVAVQGSAIGGGLGLALVGDFRIASEEARFSGNFVKIGIHPGFGISYLLPRLIGMQRAAMLLYTGRRYTGAEAADIGLVDVVVQSSALERAAIELAAEIAEGAPLAVEATRATLRLGLADAVARQVDLETAEQLRLFASADFQEGLAAVAARRPGNWQRR